MSGVTKPTLRVEAYGLARARESLKLTQAELARRTGKQVNYFYMLEALKRWPSRALQEAILKHLPGYAWEDVFRLVLVLPDEPPTATLYVRHNSQSWQVSLSTQWVDAATGGKRTETEPIFLNT